MPSIIKEDLDAPGAHALVIGVSHYLHLQDGDFPTHDGQTSNLRQLSSAANSAANFAAWLIDEYHNPAAPLKSLRILLSPQESESLNPTIKSRLPSTLEVSATRAAVEKDFIEFKNACDQFTENVAIVYVVGHGVQLTKHGAVLLLHDFAAPGQFNKLTGSIDISSVHAGMNNAVTAQTQFWFVDSCRQPPEIARYFETLSGALTLDLPRHGTAESSTIFLAAAPGELAYGRPGKVSLFSESLVSLLRSGGASEGPSMDEHYWTVKVTGLIRALPSKVKKLSSDFGALQSVDIAGKIQEATFHIYRAIPKVKFQVDLIPEEAKTISSANITSDEGVVLENHRDWPLEKEVCAGIYLISISTNPPYNNRQKYLNLFPPYIKTQIDLD